MKRRWVIVTRLLESHRTQTLILVIRSTPRQPAQPIGGLVSLIIRLPVGLHPTAFISNDRTSDNGDSILDAICGFQLCSPAALIPRPQETSETL